MTASTPKETQVLCSQIEGSETSNSDDVTPHLRCKLKILTTQCSV